MKLTGVKLLIMKNNHLGVEEVVTKKEKNKVFKVKNKDIKVKKDALFVKKKVIFLENVQIKIVNKIDLLDRIIVLNVNKKVIFLKIVQILNHLGL